jgi:ubiquinone/menaquinone biosynthesis C-methylase UbiE
MDDFKEFTPQELRDKILNDYYENVYQQYLFGKGTQSLGIKYFEKAVEKFWTIQNPNSVLEIGGGSGEHLKYIKYIPGKKYISLDLRAPLTASHTNQISSKLKSKLQFIQGDAQKLQFKDNEFDRVFSTCLLHHVEDVFAVLHEARRVTKIGGEIAFIVPTDPGLLNQFIKKIISYPKMRKITKIKPELFYALDHKNHVGSILELIKFVFKNDKLQLHFRPFRIRSWNFNLLVVAKITKTKD